MVRIETRDTSSVCYNESPLMEMLKQQDKPKWTKTLVFTTLASTLGSAVPAGYCMGVMNSPAVHMRGWCHSTVIDRYDVELTASGIELLWSAIVSVFLVGGAVGSLIGAKLANQFGRRGCFYLCGVLWIIGGTCFCTCRMLRSVELLLVGRFLVGLAAGLTTAILPMYHSEVAAFHQRGVTSPLCGIGLTTGVVLAQICSFQSFLGGADYWHYAISLYVVLVIICYAPYQCYSESPKWLYITLGRHSDAQRQLRILRGSQTSGELISAELCDMQLEAECKDTASSFITVIKDSKLLLPLALVCAYQGGQQLSGINAIFFYSVSIFLRAGLSHQAAEWTNLGAGSLNLATALLGPILMLRCRRRMLMMFSTLLCSVFLLSFALMLYFIDHITWFTMGCIASIFLYIFVFQIGLGSIPFFIGSELFEVSPRPVAMSLGSVCSWSCNFIVGMMFPSLQNAWGALVFLPCSLTCLLLFCLTKQYLPETLGRDPSQVAPLVINGFKSKLR